MYAYISGKVGECSPTHAVIDVGGVGYFIHISLPTYSYLEGKTQAKLYVHHIQREDVQALYGFASAGEKEVFIHLLSVSGVGPNTARVVLSSMSDKEVRSAIGQGDVAAFKRVKGVGPKTAQRIIIDLKDKLGSEVQNIGNSQQVSDNTAYHEALSALIALGFPRTKASTILSKLKKEIGDGSPTTESLIKQSLQLLS